MRNFNYADVKSQTDIGLPRKKEEEYQREKHKKKFDKKLDDITSKFTSKERQLVKNSPSTTFKFKGNKNAAWV